MKTEKTKMRKIPLLVSVLFLILLAGCSSGKKQQVPVSLQNEPKSESSKGYFARERERKKRYEKEFRDTSRPMNQDHFKVMPWDGKHYNPRSERLHESNNDTIFRF